MFTWVSVVLEWFFFLIFFSLCKSSWMCFFKLQKLTVNMGMFCLCRKVTKRKTIPLAEDSSASAPYATVGDYASTFRTSSWQPKSILSQEPRSFIRSLILDSDRNTTSWEGDFTSSTRTNTKTFNYFEPRTPIPYRGTTLKSKKKTSP